MSFVSLIFQMGDCEIWSLSEGIATARPYNKIFICPNCLKSIHLGKYSETEKWAYEDEDTLHSSHTLNYKTEKGFKTHIKECSSFLNTGINRIDCNSNKKAHYFVDQLAKFSKKETHWDTQQVCVGDFLTNNEVVAYIFKNDLGPISFVAFRTKNFVLNGEKKVQIYVLWDLFTFPLFRKKGIVTKLINHGVKDLNIDTSHFPVSYPLTKASQNIVKNICKNEVFAVWGNKYQVIKKDEITV